MSSASRSGYRADYGAVVEVLAGGEQFAVPDAVDVARAVRRTRPTGQRLEIAAVDPLNLTGIVTPGPRVPAVLGQRVAYVDGVPEACDVPVDQEPALAS